MNYQIAIRWYPETMRTLAGASITNAVFTAIGSPLLHPARQFLIWNYTDQKLLFSLDGINTHFSMPANSGIIDDVTSNAALSKGLMLAQGEILYVKASTGATPSGEVDFSVFYATDGQ